MKFVRAGVRRVFGVAGSLQRNLIVNILLALLAILLVSIAVLIAEFFEHLEENLDTALAREAKEVLIQADPAAPDFGMNPQALRFRGPGGAYRYSVFGPDGQAVAGGETSALIRNQLAGLPPGRAVAIDLPGDRRGAGLCGINGGTRICVLASAYAPLTDRSILQTMAHEVGEQLQWVLMGAAIVLGAALLAARLSLRPLARIRREALAIGPDSADGRLGADDLPAEIVPLVDAVNSAFARLEHGYRAQREFSSNVAHEVRTPLAVLRSGIERIEDAALRERLTRDLLSLGTIFEQLVDLARADALAAASFEPVQLHALAVRISTDRALGAIRAGKSLAVSGAGDVSVRGNAGLLAIALDNLVRNALAYSPDGTEVEIRVTANPPALHVLDRGPGVPGAEKETLFERFRRGAGTNGAQGSGIGLAIVKSVAEAHGASVRIADRDGGGSAFIFEFSKN